MQVIFTHNHADFDAIASLLAAHKLYPQAVPVLPHELNRDVAEFVTLYQNGLPFVRWDDVREKTVDHIILVDTQRVPEYKNFTPAHIPTLIIDHHPRRDDLGANVTFTGEQIGANTTLLLEQLQQDKTITLTSLEATLLALGIYSDTGSMTYSRTTPRDIQAVVWLLEHKAVLDTVRRFLTAPLNDDQQMLLDKLIQSAESRSIQGCAVVVAAARMEEYIPQVNAVTHRLSDILDPSALFVLVEMDGAIQMVCRSRTDAIDVGAIAKHFGGGGHVRAAAAKIYAHLPDALDNLWALLEATVQPAARVSELMSYGIQTVEVDQPIAEIIQQLRRIGHEGYPVLEEGRVVGLLTRRDADRALEHGLKEAIVRDVMVGGGVTLNPDDGVSKLERLMVQSGWGQIPVVDGHGHLIGIVTRTDLINHWVKVHPTTPPQDDRLDPAQIEHVLGEAASALIHTIADHARQQQISVYMVGGIVRDLLLHRPNFDVDFVVEGDAIAFAESLSAVFGGEVASFRPFGTAKWRLDEVVMEALKVRNLPEHVDFATSRNEFYEHPTALPSVYSSSIKLDLHRRDFTINTLAVQLSPERNANRPAGFLRRTR